MIETVSYFSDPDVCVEFVSQMKWMGKPECPYCQSTKHSYLKTRRIWKCAECRRQFSVKAGTIFEDSPIPLNKWLIAIWMVVNCKNGVSSYEIHRTIGVTQKTAWFMLHRIRLALKNNSLFKFGGDTGPVEIDETHIGGKQLNMHKARRARYNAAGGHHGKTVVMGMLDRDLRQVRAMVVPNTKRETLQNEIFKEIAPGSEITLMNGLAMTN